MPLNTMLDGAATTSMALGNLVGVRTFRAGQATLAGSRNAVCTWGRTWNNEPTPNATILPSIRLNSLPRGEISASETYKQALDKAEQHPISEPLRWIRQEHERAIERLCDRIRQLGGQPLEDSGVWGMWAKAVEGTAKLAGMKLAIQALEAGEGRGLEQYRYAIHNGTLPKDVALEIQREFLPRQERHIDTLALAASSL